VRIDVVELDEPPLVATMASGSDEGATSQIPQPDRAFDRGRGVAGPGFVPRERRGFLVSENFFFASSTSRAVSARSRIAASSPDGIA
jgi:hypothetical protein